MKAIVVWNSWSSLSAADEGKSVAGTYIIRRQKATTPARHLYKPPGLPYRGGRTWTRISRQPIIAITRHFSQQTLLEQLTVSGARASCFGERYRDVLYQNLDENNSNKDRLLYSSTSYVNNSVTVRVCVCATCSLVGTPILSIVVWNQTLYELLRMMLPLLLCRQQGEEPTKRHMECGTAGETSMPTFKCGCFSSAT